MQIPVSCEPTNLVKVKGTTNVYCTAEHDRLKISNGKWYWWSRGFGGVSALEYLMKVRGYGFMESMEILTNRSFSYEPLPPAPKEEKEKVLLLPDRYRNCDRVTKYLFGRGIDLQIIKDCVDEGVLFESAGSYHNAVFVGKDEQGVTRYAACRGLGGSFRGDASGSDKRYSFRFLAKESAASVHLFEAAIDLLFYVLCTISVMLSLSRLSWIICFSVSMRTKAAGGVCRRLRLSIITSGYLTIQKLLYGKEKRYSTSNAIPHILNLKNILMKPLLILGLWHFMPV